MLTWLPRARLLSDKGIPKLRKKFETLRFKGKGHEFSDAARLLEFYQLWLDDLFPKARFLDALAMVEKVGHKATVRMARQAIIDETRPGKGVSMHPGDDEEAEDPANRIAEDRDKTRPAVVPAILDAAKRAGQDQSSSAGASGAQPRHEDDVPSDIEDFFGDSMTPAPPASARAAAPAAQHIDSIFGRPGPATRNDDVPDDEDDLDALIAEAEAATTTTASRNPAASTSTLPLRSSDGQATAAAPRPATPPPAVRRGYDDMGEDYGIPDDEDIYGATPKKVVLEREREHLAQEKAANAAASAVEDSTAVGQVEKSSEKGPRGAAADEADELELLMAEAESGQTNGGLES